MDLLALVAALSVMGTVLAGGMAVYSGQLSVGARIRGRLESALAGTSVIEGSQIAPALRESRATVSGMLAAVVSGEWLSRLAVDLERADTNVRPMEFVATRLTLAGLGFAVPYLFMGPSATGILAAAGGAVAGFMLPRLYINRRKQARVDKLNNQLPETLTLVSNSLKAGFGLLQSLDLAARQMEHPIATELARTIHEMNVGSTVEQALLGLSERTDSYDLDLVVTAIIVQRTVGGNLSEILDTVAETMRERERLRGEIKTLTAQQKMTGIVIALLPVAVGGIFMLASPGYMSELFTSSLGKIMLASAALLETVGIIIIRRILTIEL